MITLKVNFRLCFDAPAFDHGNDQESRKSQADNIEKDIRHQFTDVQIIRACTENGYLKVKGYAYEAEVRHYDNSSLPS